MTTENKRIVRVSDRANDFAVEKFWGVSSTRLVDAVHRSKLRFVQTETADLAAVGRSL